MGRKSHGHVKNISVLDIWLPFCRTFLSFLITINCFRKIHLSKFCANLLVSCFFVHQPQKIYLRHDFDRFKFNGKFVFISLAEPSETRKPQILYNWSIIYNLRQNFLTLHPTTLRLYAKNYFKKFEFAQSANIEAVVSFRNNTSRYLLSFGKCYEQILNWKVSLDSLVAARHCGMWCQSVRLVHS